MQASAVFCCQVMNIWHVSELSEVSTSLPGSWAPLAEWGPWHSCTTYNWLSVFLKKHQRQSPANQFWIFRCWNAEDYGLQCSCHGILCTICKSPIQTNGKCWPFVWPSANSLDWESQQIAVHPAGCWLESSMEKTQRLTRFRHLQQT